MQVIIINNLFTYIITSYSCNCMSLGHIMELVPLMREAIISSRTLGASKSNPSNPMNNSMTDYCSDDDIIEEHPLFPI